MPLSKSEALERANTLRNLNQPYLADRTRIRAIMNGGRAGIQALLGAKAAASLGSDDFPVVHLMDSGLTRLAQRLGRAPDLKVDPRQDRDSDREKDRAEKRRRIVSAYDHNSRLELDLPQAARWLPGYGFAVWVIRERAEDGNFYPHAELRDPFDCYPGSWGPNQQPLEMAIARIVDEKRLANQYPAFASKLDQRGGDGRTFQPTDASWNQTAGGVAVVEYYDESGTYLLAPDFDLLLDFIPNPLESGPRFVMVKRYSFDRLIGQYAHIVGLMAQMAKLNVLSVIAAEDSVFRETNVFGELESGQYMRGRFAVNHFAPGTRVEKPVGDVAFQVFQQIDRLERQLRISANYSEMEDAQSPTAWATGQGLDRLGQGSDANISEYQTALRHGLEMLDSKRLEWDEQMYGGTRKPLVTYHSGEAVVENYEPEADIAGDYRTRRVYGVMAGWDDPAKIVTGLQLRQGRVIDTQTFRDNLHGVDDGNRIEARLLGEETQQTLMAILQQRALPTPEAPQGDPAATLALVEINENPDQVTEILKKFFTPQEPQISPEEEAFMAAQGGGGPMGDLAAAGGPPPAVSTVLSRVEGSGATEGGVQTVGRL